MFPGGFCLLPSVLQTIGRPSVSLPDPEEGLPVGGALWLWTKLICAMRMLIM